MNSKASSDYVIENSLVNIKSRFKSLKYKLLMTRFVSMFGILSKVSLNCRITFIPSTRTFPL